MSNLFEVNPTYMRKCTIRGVAPLLIIGRQKSASEDSPAPPDGTDFGKQYETKTWNFCPEARFYVGKNHTWWPFAEKTLLLTGGWAIGTFSLDQLYNEHLYNKNRWSVSNCGFDLAKYRGTTLYLEQHEYIDYIFFHDSEYDDIFKFREHTDLHPMILLTHPQTLLIKSRRRAGPRRTRKVYIPRPAWWPSGWSAMKDIAKTGLFCYFVMAVDLDNPWLGKYQNPWDVQRGRWWENQAWLTEWNNYVRNDSDTVSGSFRAQMYNNLKYAQVRGGPFMLKNWKVEHEDYIYPQLSLWYKSYWTWGGRSLTIKTVCDPSKPFSVD